MRRLAAADKCTSCVQVYYSATKSHNFTTVQQKSHQFTTVQHISKSSVYYCGYRAVVSLILVLFRMYWRTSIKRAGNVM